MGLLILVGLGAGLLLLELLPVAGLTEEVGGRVREKLLLEGVLTTFVVVVVVGLVDDETLLLGVVVVVEGYRGFRNDDGTRNE